jgi:hypothetical protein
MKNMTAPMESCKIVGDREFKRGFCEVREVAILSNRSR